MKMLIAKFKILAALDRGAALSAFWRRRVAATPELERFSESARQLDGLLRQPAGAGALEPPADLQACIMRAGRQERPSGRVSARARGLEGWAPALGWGLAAALFLGAGLGAWLVFRPTGSGPFPWAGARAAGPLPTVAPLVEQVARSGAAMLSQPMNRQLEELSRDLNETAQFLLASLP
jgi:hypothetical protein